MKTSELYTVNLNATEDIVINQGGTSSGKTYSIMQALFSIAISQKSKDILVVGQSIPNLKRGALKDAQDILASNPDLQTCITSYNKSDRIYTFASGSTMLFTSFLDYQDAKNGKRDYSFFNEVNGIEYGIFKEIALMGRTRIRTYVDYNPNEEFYIHHLRDNPPSGTSVKFIRSWHEHNPFLEEKQHKQIEGIKELDEELWRVYARGYTGKIEGLVYRNWEIKTEVPQNAQYIATGLDFGFTHDPSASVEVYQHNDNLYLKEEVYETGLTTPDLFKKLDKGGKYIADSARPDTIEELRRMGLRVEGANKHLKSKNQKGSIGTGIDILKRYKLYVVGSNIVRELKSYKYKEDKSGNPINEPVDFMNHALDAIRYVALNKLKTNSSGKYDIR